MRVCLTIEYDGARFCGWQWQRGAVSVQETLGQAIKALTQDNVTLFAAGRTDQGVHALGQVVHFDVHKRWDMQVMQRGLNAHLRGTGVMVVHACEACPPFHARFSAINRHYCYKIMHRSSPSVLQSHCTWWVPYDLDFQAMDRGCQVLCGTHDFSAFRHKHCQSQTPVRTMDRLWIERHGDEVWVHAWARSFLHRQVRMMVGALVYVGRGKWSVDTLEEVLVAGRSTIGPRTAPAAGLCLTRVVYDPDPRQEGPGGAKI